MKKNRPISFITRKEGQCGWIIGEARDLKCCGQPAEYGRYYCPEHREIARQKPRVKAEVDGKEVKVESVNKGVVTLAKPPKKHAIVSVSVTYEIQEEAHHG